MAAEYLGRKQIDKNLVELIGWIITEGSFLKSGNGNGIYIYQSKSKKHYINRIKSCLNNLNFKYTIENKEYKNRRTKEKPWVAIYIKSKYGRKVRKIINKKEISRKILNTWNFKSLTLLRDVMLLGDGCKKESGFGVF